MSSKIYDCDLHAHTTRSDGNDSPQQLIDNAVELGLKAVAITDHDTPPPEYINTSKGTVPPKEYAKICGIELVLGYEFSTDTYVDDVHIIGYELNWSHPLVKEEVNRAKKSKSEAYRKLCEILTEKGMPIDYDKEILRYYDSEGNIKKRDSTEVERKFIFEKMAKKGYAESWERAKLLVRDDPELNVRRPKIDPEEAISLIHECGGIAVLAHPYLIDKRIKSEKKEEASREEYIDNLINQGLDGIEARYTYNKTSYKGNKNPEQIETEIRNRYADKLYISGGSDYHAGGKKGVANPRFLGEAGISFEEFKKLKETFS